MDTILPFFTLANIVTYLIVMNFVAFAAFGLDKSFAENRRWRIAESTLLMWALLGGSPGAYAGRSLFRHKTRMQPFSNNLFSIVLLQVMVIGWFVLG